LPLTCGYCGSPLHVLIERVAMHPDAALADLERRDLPALDQFVGATPGDSQISATSGTFSTSFVVISMISPLYCAVLIRYSTA
jgi:hypothetical protein